LCKTGVSCFAEKAEEKVCSDKVDLEQLSRRSQGTEWDFSQVRAWLADPSQGRALCLLAGAGTGKSTVSAALVDVLSAELPEGHAAAHHFLKHSDARRLDPVRLVKSLAFQLAVQIPRLREVLFQLDVNKMDRLSSAEEAFELLLRGPLGEQPVVLLIDALDEADPAAEQEAGFDPLTAPVIPLANKALCLILGCLAKLPGARFVFTARPDTARGSLLAALERAVGAVQVVEPSQVRRGEGQGRDQAVLVYDTVVRECGLALPPSAAPT
jgi:hypothetical protein